ncbi:MAG: RsmB/NOP family class I SAM-dependent RNA methyltransferase [Butyribacter sp.]|nr:RsmB/NOP family class I SAM-dependent RNA methyltransferase [bacterium]MDY3854121.1 RsmB/NOP family class I SAM-dependent RNA methyltransferase [Butyribacter sp.]
MTNLPDDFISRMKEQLGSEADAFFASYQQPKAYGLRINPLKYQQEDCNKNLPFTLTPVAWAKEGFYAVSEEHPGRHPLHEGGAYYIQEPSAMSVVSLLAPEPGDIICDLCAAPGGKSTQIAGRLLGEGLLVSNEIFSARAKILSQNVERCGVGNCVVCNEPPDRMAEHFPLFFHKIVVDAPCSGEGMFRKDEMAIQEWSPEQVAVCASRQKMILECADRMLAPGGVLVYSTCTFAPEEDEEMITWFLEEYPDYQLEDWRQILPDDCGLEGGQTPETQKALRLWPHKLQGEGHFVARLRKSGALPSAHGHIDKKGKKKSATKKTQNTLEDYEIFCKQFLQKEPADAAYSILRYLSENASYQYFGNELYLLPRQMPSVQGLKVVRAGLHLGTLKKNRFEPAHALAKALAPKDVMQCQECDYETALRYLKGETIPCDTTFRSWTLVSYDGVSLGWGKAQNGILKNHYPKGLRIMA